MHHEITQEQAERITEINAQLEKLDKKLSQPDRTVGDIIKHMQLLKELESI